MTNTNFSPKKTEESSHIDPYKWIKRKCCYKPIKALFSPFSFVFMFNFFVVIIIFCLVLCVHTRLWKYINWALSNRSKKWNEEEHLRYCKFYSCQLQDLFSHYFIWYMLYATACFALSLPLPLSFTLSLFLSFIIAYAAVPRMFLFAHDQAYIPACLPAFCQLFVLCFTPALWINSLDLPQTQLYFVFIGDAMVYLWKENCMKGTQNEILVGALVFGLMIKKVF